MKRQPLTWFALDLRGYDQVSNAHVTAPPMWNHAEVTYTAARPYYICYWLRLERRG